MVAGRQFQATKVVADNREYETSPQLLPVNYCFEVVQVGYGCARKDTVGSDNGRGGPSGLECVCVCACVRGMG